MSSSELGSGDTVVTSAPSPTESPSITALTNTTDWRPYTFEHPLTAATSAMLNISGASEDPSSGFGILYDYHYGKLGQISQIQHLSHNPEGSKGEKTLSADIWSPVVVSSIGNGSVTGSKGNNGDGPEVYVPSIHQSKLSSASVLRRGESKLQKLSHNAIIEHSGQNGQSRYGHSNGDMSPHHHSPTHSIHSLHSGGHGGHILQNPHSGVIVLKEEGPHSPGSPRNGLTSLHVSTPPTPPSHLSPTPVSGHDPDEDHGHYQSPQLFATLSNPPHPSHVSHGSPYDFVGGGNVQFAPNLRGGGGNVISSVYPVGNSPTEPYYRVDFFANEFGASGVTTASRQLSPYDGGPEGPSFVVDRYVRGGGSYKQTHGGHGGLPVDLPSPDSGIGTEAITPRDSSHMQQGFDYTELCQQGLINEMGGGSNGRASPATSQHSQSQPKSTRPWHDFGRQNEADKIQIPKLFTTFGFRYYLESPISTSQRRDDDRITYINKGQFYGITLDFLTDTDKPIKSQTVKTVVMLVFREEKSPDDEIKAWQFWHGRQHSVKQRILDADTKNSVGLVGCIDEIAHNAIAVYWNPMESSAKINVAVQCLSTDFSSQKGVKGLPLHIQIDTYDDPRDPNCPIAHRGYCQIKVFCDKGAERKTRDEERRAAKRKLTANGRKKVDDLYHTSAERSEFYSMSDLTKPPVLFTPAEDIDKLTSLELHGFYSTHSEGSEQSATLGGNPEERLRMMRCGSGQEESPPRSPPHHHPGSQGQGTILKFHHNFPPDSPPSYIRHTSNLANFSTLTPPGPPHVNSASNSPPPPPPPTHQPVSVISNSGEKRKEDEGDLDLSISQTDSDGHPRSSMGKRRSCDDGTNGHSSSENSVNDRAYPTSPSSVSSLKRIRLLPPPSERLMLYVRQEGEEAFTPLHLVPPSRDTLVKALEEKYEISLESLRHLLRRNAKGVLAKLDDEMLRHYCHEDSFLLDITRDGESMDVTLTEETTDTLSS